MKKIALCAAAVLLLVLICAGGAAAESYQLMQLKPEVKMGWMTKKRIYGSPVTGTIKPGETLTCLGKYEGSKVKWYLLRKDDGIAGWIDQNYVTSAGTLQPADVMSYTNYKYSYQVNAPKGFTAEKESDSGDGRRFYDQSGKCEIAVWGSNVLEENDNSIGGYLADFLKSNKGVKWTIATTGRSDYCRWMIASGVQGKQMLWVKCIYVDAAEIELGVSVTYPVNRKAEFAKAVNIAISSLETTVSMEERQKADQKEQKEFEEQTQEPKTIRDFTKEEIIRDIKEDRKDESSKRVGEVFDKIFEKQSWSLEYVTNPLYSKNELALVTFRGYFTTTQNSKEMIQIGFLYGVNDKTNKPDAVSVSYVIGQNGKEQEGLPSWLMYELE